MKKAKYQENYAALRPQMYQKKSREVKAIRIVKLLTDYFGKHKLKTLTVLDVGASTGIIDNTLAKHFKNVVGGDIDKTAITFAKKNFKRSNLVFKTEDAMNLSFRDNSFDVVVCTHVYEHVSNPKKMFDEIYRVLKPGGACYLAAINSLWPIEPHYNLPFLSWLPKKIADKYVSFLGKSKEYYEHPQTYWGLKKITTKFIVWEYTQKILQNPRVFGFENKITGLLKIPAFLLSPLSKFLAPTFFWLLTKEV